MKKTSISFMMVLTILLLSACNYNNADTVKNGTYVLEKEKKASKYLPLSYVTISDDEILFTYDLLSSYLPHGTYSIDDGKLTMKTDDNKYVYVFEIHGDNLVFQKNESSAIKMIDSRLGFELKDNATFHLRDD